MLAVCIVHCFDVHYLKSFLVADAKYGQACNPPSINCISNYICTSASVCSCDETVQFYNGTYCVSKFGYNDTCSQTRHCANASNLYCVSYVVS